MLPQATCIKYQMIINEICCTLILYILDVSIILNEIPNKIETFQIVKILNRWESKILPCMTVNCRKSSKIENEEYLTIQVHCWFFSQ